jgi:phosphoribosylamine--glycine ligase
MKVLVVGGGGREHALAWKLARSTDRARSLVEVFCAPGNAGTAREPGCTNIPAASTDEVAQAAAELLVDLVVVGPEKPLVEGLSDRLRAEGILCLGPSREAARLEGSKVFAKEFMNRHGIPTAHHVVAESPEEARSAVSDMGLPIVLKADGLAAGKGVVVCRSEEEAHNTIGAFMVDRSLGPAGDRFVVERMLSGWEATILALTDGTHIAELPPSQDHKPIGEGNTGPNTGGMGVLCPHPGMGREVLERFRSDILWPTLEGIHAEGLDYRGVLYFGLMIQDGHPYLLEYNVRFGDPEAQAVLPLLDADLAELLKRVSEGNMGPIDLPTNGRASCVVVAASGGYPSSYLKGYPVSGLEKCESPVFIAGAEEQNGRTVTSGGRVLAVCGLGPDLSAARQAAYGDLERISFEDMYYRRDIGRLS